MKALSHHKEVDVQNCQLQMVVLWAEIFFYSMYDFVRSGAGAGGKQGLRVQKLGEVILSDQSYCPWELPKKLTKIGQPGAVVGSIAGRESFRLPARTAGWGR